MEDGRKKTEELLEKKMSIMKDELSAELGVRMDQANQKMDEITAKFNRDVETIQSDHEGMWQQISIHSNKMKEAAKDTEEMVEKRLKENVDEIEKRMAVLLSLIHI